MASPTDHDPLAAPSAGRRAPGGGDAAASLASLSATLDHVEGSAAPAGRSGLATDAGAEPGDSPPAAREPREPRGGGRYRVLRSHARGGLGAVYVAEDRELGREVALKEIRADRPQDGATCARFLFEGE